MVEMRLAGVDIAHLVAFGEELVDAGEHVVAEHDRDFQTGRGLQHGARAGYRIDAAGVGDDFDAAVAELVGDASDERRKIAGVAEIGVLLALLLQDGHGDFGQVVESEIVDRPAVHQTDGGFEPVAPEALTVSDAIIKDTWNHRWTQINTDFIESPGPAE
jgi:hypothetical protein